MAKVLEYMRCPCCGKVSRGPSFGLAVSPGHRLELLRQSFVGGTAGFRWDRAPLPDGHRAGLADVVRGVLARLDPQAAGEVERLRGEAEALRGDAERLRAQNAALVALFTGGSARVAVATPPVPSAVRPASMTFRAKEVRHGQGL